MQKKKIENERKERNKDGERNVKTKMKEKPWGICLYAKLIHGHDPLNRNP